jgi:hypothetical protein
LTALGGEGGVGRYVNTSTQRIKKYSKVKEEKDFLKNSEKQEYTNEDKRKYFLAIEKIAFPYWAVLPDESRDKSSFSDFTFTFHLLKNKIPELSIYFGYLHKVHDTWKEGYYPAAHSFLKKAVNMKLKAEDIDSITRQKKDFERMAQNQINKFNGDPK